MFEDLIKDNRERIGRVTKDSIIEAMKENIQLKEEHIMDLLGELVERQDTIDILQKKIDYLEKL